MRSLLGSSQLAAAVLALDGLCKNLLCTERTLLGHSLRLSAAP
jgi:hypothetical protein